MPTANLSAIEAIMWRAGRDPARRLTVGALLLLDKAPEVKDLVERMQTMADQNPRLHWVPDDPTYSRTRPAWVEEEDQEASRHVRSIDLAAPGSERELLDVVALLEALPFDAEQSPWDVTLLRGLGNEGGAAVYLRAHHVLTDGLGGLRLLHELLDDAVDGDAPAPVVRRLRTGTSASERDGDDADTRRPGTITIELDLNEAFRAVAGRISQARGVQPMQTAVGVLQTALDMATSVSHQMMVVGGPLSPVARSRSALSHVSVLSVPNAKHTAKELGGSRNDLLVLAVATAIGRYFSRGGEPCPMVRVATPTHLHGQNHEGNSFVPARCEIPTDASHPQLHFGVVQERLAHARHEPALRLTTTLATSLSRLPNRVLLPALNAQLDTVDVSVTALPGLRGAPTLCGSAVTTAYPVGPRLGIPLNITAFGNNGGLDIGIALDPAAMTDPDGFKACLAQAFDDVLS